MTVKETSQSIVTNYKKLLGRNYYSQLLRDYVDKKYKDNKYYSDCSSSVAWAFKTAGIPITYNGSKLPNTVGMYSSKDMVDVTEVVIKNGVIQNPEVLHECDILLFAGSDSSRSYAGYVGHVEMVAAVSSGGKKVTIYGHGSNRPRSTEMNAYCKSRYQQKTSTKLGHKGLIKVRRHRLLMDGNAPTTYKLGDRTLKDGSVGEDVRELQEALISLGYSCGPDGADGEFGSNTAKAVKSFQSAHNLDATGTAEASTIAALKQALGLDVTAQPVSGPCVVISNCVECNIRTGPDKEKFKSIGRAKPGDVFSLPDLTGWTPIIFNGEVRFVSGLYTTEVKQS